MDDVGTMLFADPNAFLTPEEVSDRLKISPVTPYSWSRRGVIPSFKIEGCLRFRAADINEFIRQAYRPGREKMNGDSFSSKGVRGGARKARRAH